jgi:hypothetical protein
MSSFSTGLKPPERISRQVLDSLSPFARDVCEYLVCQGKMIIEDTEPQGVSP